VIESASSAREAYEQMRRHVVAAAPGSGRFGVAVLLREGVAAWIERCATSAPSQSVPPPSQPLSPFVTPPFQAGIVQILVHIALSRNQEMHG